MTHTANDFDAATMSYTAQRIASHALYYAAIAADSAFHNALVALYGKRAGDMRYRSAEHPPEIRALGERKIAADAAMWLGQSSF